MNFRSCQQLCWGHLTADHFNPGPRERDPKDHKGGLLPIQKNSGGGSTWGRLQSKCQRYLFMLKLSLLFVS